MQKSETKIVIIGAGAAGLAAGIKLIEYGFENITILEAEDRIGGRVKSVMFHNSMIDEGAQWCHGEKGNIVYEMVKDLNMVQASKIDYFFDNQFFNYSGAHIDRNLTHKLLLIALKVADDKDALANTKCSFGQYFLTKYFDEVKTLGLNDAENEIANLFSEWFTKRFAVATSATDWNDISSSGLNDFRNCEGNEFLTWKNKGYGSFLQVLMKSNNGVSVLDDKILLNKKVDKINWSNLAHIQCADGETYNADHVIFTASMGVLKAKHETMFTPNLPINKKEAIEAVGFGGVGKILIKFPYKWWGDAGSFGFFYTETDRNDLINEFKDDPIKNGKSWLEDIFSVFAIDSHETTLLTWMVGELVSEVEHLSNDRIIIGLNYVLKRFLSQQYDIPPIEDIVHTNWRTNDNFKGSYSYRSVKYENEHITFDVFSEPLYDSNQRPIIQFAGEGTHPHFYSTVHGATETGFREAKRINDYYK